MGPQEGAGAGVTRRVLYVAAPVRPTTEEVAAMVSSDGWILTDASAADKALRSNLYRAMAWLRWLRRSFPETTFIAPWIASIMAGKDDADPSQREAGLIDDCAVVERCDGIVLCGPRISEGMRREMEHGQAHGWVANGDGADQTFEVYDLTSLGRDLPSPRPRGDFRAEYAIWEAEFKR